jgi:hypothetical protein
MRILDDGKLAKLRDAVRGFSATVAGLGGSATVAGLGGFQDEAVIANKLDQFSFTGVVRALYRLFKQIFIAASQNCFQADGSN